jgi:hypothetical protein
VSTSYLADPTTTKKHMDNDALILGFNFEPKDEGIRYMKHNKNVISFLLAIQWSQLQEVTVTAGAVTFYLMGQTCNFSSDSVRAYVFQQLLCRTYALTPSGSKVMVHGVFNPQYQGYGKKSSQEPTLNFCIANLYFSFAHL